MFQKEKVMSDNSTPEVCSNCREALCVRKLRRALSFIAGAKFVCGVEEHGIVKRNERHHRVFDNPDDAPASAACTRAKLVEVKGCYECQFRFVLSCIFPGRERKILAERHAQCPDGCPLLTDSKPNAGIKIMAVMEEKT